MYGTSFPTQCSCPCVLLALHFGMLIFAYKIRWYVGPVSCSGISLFMGIDSIQLACIYLIQLSSLSPAADWPTLNGVGWKICKLLHIAFDLDNQQISAHSYQLATHHSGYTAETLLTIPKLIEMCLILGLGCNNHTHSAEAEIFRA